MRPWTLRRIAGGRDPITRKSVWIPGHRDIQTTMRCVHHQTKAEDADLGGAYLDRVLTPTTAAS
jgi:hypothetical protein